MGMDSWCKRWKGPLMAWPLALEGKQKSTASAPNPCMQAVVYWHKQKGVMLLKGHGRKPRTGFEPVCEVFSTSLPTLTATRAMPASLSFVSTLFRVGPQLTPVTHYLPMRPFQEPL